MSTIGQRIASWFWRDLQLRAGFREVTDQIPDSAALITYWVARVDEEIGDNRFIAALEEIRDLDYRGHRHESAFIAIRALGPAKQEQAAKLGVTQFAADGDAHRVEQLTLDQAKPTSTAQIIDEMIDRSVRNAFKPTIPGYTSQPDRSGEPGLSPDEFL